MNHASADYDSTRGRRSAYKLATKIQSFAQQLDASVHVAEIKHLWEESAEILRVLHDRNPGKYQVLYSRTLYCLGTHLREAGYWEKAERSLREGSRLCRQRYNADSTSEPSCELLASTLYEYAKTLEKLERNEEAQQITSEVLGLCRKLFESRHGPSTEIPAFVRGFGDFLFAGQRLASNSNQGARS
jgi:tetratricopeptide (TPR) repeat protein